jgi:hypothetical protein
MFPVFVSRTISRSVPLLSYCATTGSFAKSGTIISNEPSDATASGGNPIEAQGIGNISRLGPLFLTVKKCGTLQGSVVTLLGTFKMTAGNGDTLEGTVNLTVFYLVQGNMSFPEKD